jgi:hypothetical protein
MTTLYAFTPSATQVFVFQPILDAVPHLCRVPWNLAGQRWYLECYDQSGNLVFNVPRVASPLLADINLAAGYFNSSTLVYRGPATQFEVTP